MFLEPEKVNWRHKWAMVKTMVSAFERDSLMTYLTYKSRICLGLIFWFLIEFGLKIGKIQVSSSKFEGVAIWLPSGLSDGMILKAAWKQLLVCCFYKPKAIARVSEYLDFCQGIEDREAPRGQGYWTLFQFGVAKNRQSKGIGTGMLEEAFGFFRESPCYLETGLGLREFYGKRGFVLKDLVTFVDPKARFTYYLHAMVRPAVVPTYAENEEAELALV